MLTRPTTPEKACADLIRKGICLMECIGSGKRWCDAVTAKVDEGKGRRDGR